MSPRHSRIQRSRKRGGRSKQWLPDDEALNPEPSGLPVCLEEEEEEAAATAAVTSRVQAACDGDAPLKLFHLKVAAERGHLEAMYMMAQTCGDRVERIHWLTMAAERGHVAAMHDLGLASAALHERRRWLLRAAQHGWAEAMAELGDVECS